MSRPIVYDLFCGLGLGQSQFLLGADSFVEEFVTGRAQNPNHVRLSVLNLAARTFALILWPVGKFGHTAFPARLADLWQIRESAAQASHYSPSRVRSPGVVAPLDSWIFENESPLLFFARLACAFIRAIAAVRRRCDDGEVGSANEAVSPSLGYVGLFFSSQSTNSGLAAKRAIQLVRSFCIELFSASVA